MKNWLRMLIVCLGFWTDSFAQSNGVISNGRAGNTTTPATGGYSYIYQQDFESGSIPSGWTVNNGSVTWNYNTAPAPLVGSFSAEMADGSSAFYTSIGPVTEVWVYFIANVNDAGSRFFTIADSGGANNLLNLSITGGEPTVDDGTVSASTTASGFSLGSTAHFWAHYKAGSGANATIEIWWNTTATQLTDAAHHAISNIGVKTTSADRLQIMAFFGTGGQINIFDKLRASASLIGSNPN